MGKPATARIEEVLTSFADVIARLMIDQYQQQIAELDLTLPQAQVLRVLRRSPMQTGQLAAELRTSAPAITQLTDRLIRKELIERRSGVGDRRCVIVALTEKGQRLVDEFRRRRGEVFSEALARFDWREQEQVVEVLEKVVGALESFHASGNSLSQERVQQ